MKRIIFIFLFITVSLSFISCTSIDRAQPVEVTDFYKISNVNVIDVINETIKYNHDVVVENGIIVSVHLHSPMERDDIAIMTINGRGKYLIPGLWDNHSTVLQTSPELDFPLYIANGVTSIRSNLSCPNEDELSIYACMKDKSEWTKAIESDAMVGPTIHGWGTYPIHGKRKNHPDSPPFHSAYTREEAKQVIEHYSTYPKEHRPYFIKTYNWIKPEQYTQLSVNAKQQGFELSGHMPRSLALTDVVDAGQRSFAHARLFLFDCSSLSAELQAGKHKKTPLPVLYRMLISAFDEKGCEQKYQYLADNNVYLNPTLMTRRNDYYITAGKTDEIKGLDFVHYLLALSFKEAAAELGENLSVEDIKAFKDFYLLSAHTIAQAQKSGVKVLAGTDSWNDYVVPGFSLHEEMQALAQAGLDNYAVLQAATINGAEYFRIADKVGSLDVGKQANMVLLDANPIENIVNAQAINTVFKGGQIYKKEQLKRFKHGVKELSGSHFVTLKILLMLAKNPTGFM